MENKSTLISILIVIFFILPGDVYSQFSVGLNALYQLSTIEQLDAGYRFEWGGAIEIFSPSISGEIPIQLMGGIQLNYLFGGRERRNISLDLSSENDGKVIVNNQQVGILGIARIAAPKSYLMRPYLDMIAGVGFYVSEDITRLRGFRWSDETRTLDRFIITQDTRPRIGGGLGLLIQVSNYVGLDFRASYLQTGKINHVDLESVTEQNDIIEYDLNRTEVNPWNFQVGVRILVE